MSQPQRHRVLAMPFLMLLLLVPPSAAHAAAAPPAPGHHFAAGIFTGSAPFGMAAAVSGRQYAGSTSPNQEPMTMVAGRKRLVRVSTMYNTDCFAYTGVLRTSALKHAKFGRKGRFSFKVKSSLLDSPNVWWSGDAFPDEIVEQFKGKMTKRAVTGSIRATLKFLDGSTCTTGKEAFLVTHQPRQVFGGLTSQSMPVSVELTSDRQRIRHLHIGWDAPCTTGGELVLADFLTNFDLVGGLVDTSFVQTYSDGEGGLVVYDYKVSARVAGSTSTGTLSVVVNAIGADGTTGGSCTSPAVSWTAKS
jgi:hypothetical protein